MLGPEEAVAGMMEEGDAVVRGVVAVLCAREDDAVGSIPYVFHGRVRRLQAPEYVGVVFEAAVAFETVDAEGIQVAVVLQVSAPLRKCNFSAECNCHFMAVSTRWVCSLDYPLLVGLKPVKS